MNFDFSPTEFVARDAFFRGVWDAGYVFDDGVLALAVIVAVLPAVRDPRAHLDCLELVAWATGLMTLLHVWGAVRRIQPWTEDLEIALYGAVFAISTWLRFALAFPDTYEVGMSNLGFRLLYHALNEVPGVACERVFLPWPDLEGMLRERGLPLFTLESRAPVKAFDVLGVTLQFELAYTSVLAMLDLAGIPLLAGDRAEDDPLVVGGGPCAYNPEPVADFFDCFAVGEGEELALETPDADAESGFRRGGASREELLRRLARIPGVYVPRFFRPRYDPATRRYLQRRCAEGKTKSEAIRCLKRYLARSLYRLLENPPMPT